MRKFSWWTIYEWVILVGLLQSFKAYFLWGISDIIMQIALVAVSLFSLVISPYLFTYSKNNAMWFLLLLLASSITSINSNFNGFLFSVLRILPVFFILLLKTDYKINLFLFIRKWFSLLLLISVTGWILYLIGVELPYKMIYYGSYEGFAHYTYENHYLYLVQVSRFITFPRFYSVFIEPGYLGCLLSIMLFLGNYKFDKTNIPFWISLFLTFSLAGWILTLFGFVAMRLVNSKYRITWLVTIVTVMLISSNFAKKYNDGNNWVNYAFFNRLENDAEKGIAGYNRSSEATTDYFWNTFFFTEDVFFGNPEIRESGNKGADADWKSYIMLYGLVGFIAYFIYLVYPWLIFKNNKYRLSILIILYALIFAQTIFGAFWLIYLTVFIIGCSVITPNKEYYPLKEF